MIVNTKYNKGLFFGGLISCIILCILLMETPYTNSFKATALIFLVFVYLTLEKQLYRIVVKDDIITLHFRAFIFLNTLKNYSLENVSYKISKEVYYRAGVIQQLYLFDDQHRVILKIDKGQFSNSEIDQLLEKLDNEKA